MNQQEEEHNNRLLGRLTEKGGRGQQSLKRYSNH